MHDMNILQKSSSIAFLRCFVKRQVSTFHSAKLVGLLEVRLILILIAISKKSQSMHFNTSEYVQMYVIKLKQYCIWVLEKMEALHTLGSLIAPISRLTEGRRSTYSLLLLWCTHDCQSLWSFGLVLNSSHTWYRFSHCTPN